MTSSKINRSSIRGDGQVNEEQSDLNPIVQGSYVSQRSRVSRGTSHGGQAMLDMSQDVVERLTGNYSPARKLCSSHHNSHVPSVSMPVERPPVQY